jgi:hypothetical protein
MTDDMSTENLGPAEITNHLTVIIKLWEHITDQFSKTCTLTTDMSAATFWIM